MKKMMEGSAIIEVSGEKKISKKLEVFYNPAMKLNRDISVILLNAIPNTHMILADVMAGTGVRAIRFAKELKKGKIKKLYVNDLNSINKAKKNFRLNKAKASFSAEDANLFLLQRNGFDYIDLDPFGSPNDFLDAAVKRISRNGILAVTATDTAVFAGTHPKAGRRYYWAETFRNGFMHESALRILARKAQMVGMQYNKALTPILSFAREHYMRIFFKCVKGKKACDALVEQHKRILYDPKTLAYEISSRNFKEGRIIIGPLYIGTLCDKVLLERMKKNAREKDVQKLLDALYHELDVVGSYDIHALSKVLKIPVPSFEKILENAQASRVHYNDHAIKSKLSIEELQRIMRSA